MQFVLNILMEWEKRHKVPLCSICQATGILSSLSPPVRIHSLGSVAQTHRVFLVASADLSRWSPRMNAMSISQLTYTDECAATTSATWTASARTHAIAARIIKTRNHPKYFVQLTNHDIMSVYEPRADASAKRQADVEWNVVDQNFEKASVFSRVSADTGMPFFLLTR